MDDDAEGGEVALAARELGEQPDGDRLRALQGVVLPAAAHAAALNDGFVLAPEARRMLAGLEESSVLFVSRIVHRGHSRSRRRSILRGLQRRLASTTSSRHPPNVEEEQGIYRGEVTEMMFALADIKVAVLRMLSYIEGEDDDEEEEEEEDSPPDA